MKKTLLSLSLIVLALAGKAQNCSDLIISEYVEGTGNNKALEIYNASSSPISLGNYRVLRHDNGNTSFTAVEGEMQLPTNITLAPYQTYVIALNLTDPSGTGQFAPIDVALQAKADTLLCPGCATGTGNSRVMCFNGDDALALQKNVGGVWTDVDIFACRGEQPSNSSGTFSPTAAWTSLYPYASMPAGYNSSTQGPYFKQYWTQDRTLRRKPTVKQGVSVNPGFNIFNPAVEWDTTSTNGLASVNNYADLGNHPCDCLSPLSTTISANSTTVCLTQTVGVSVSVSGGSGSYTYNWQPSSEIFGVNNIASIAAKPTSTVSSIVYTVTVSDGTSSSTQTVSINAVTCTLPFTPVISASSNSVCLNQTITVTAGATYGGTGSYTYSWSPASEIVGATNTESISAKPTSTASPVIYSVTVTEVGGAGVSTMTLSMQANICDVSVKEISKEVHINIFPNPNNGKEITLVSDKNIKDIKIINVFGQLILHYPVISSQNTVILNNLNLIQGIYNIVLTNEIGTKSQKIIIE